MGRERAWTDEELIAAVEQSATLVEVLRRLGLTKGGGALTTVRRRILELGLDAPGLLRHARSDAWAVDPDDAVAQAPVRGRWTDDELRMAVVASTSMRQVMQTLGYCGSGGAWTAAKAQILALGIDTTHFGRRQKQRPLITLPKKRPRTWTDDDLRRAVAASTSTAGVIRALGLNIGGAMYITINDRIHSLGLDTSHFKGRGWNRGQSVTCWKGRPLSEILTENSTYSSTGSLRRRLIKEGLKKAACEVCGLDRWQG